MYNQVKRSREKKESETFLPCLVYIRPIVQSHIKLVVQKQLDLLQSRPMDFIGQVQCIQQVVNSVKEKSEKLKWNLSILPKSTNSQYTHDIDRSMQIPNKSTKPRRIKQKFFINSKI